jgi:RimJ/RimL family protein N-acetyltransferase
MIVAGKDVVDWVESQLGETFLGGEGVGLMRVGNLVAGVVYCNFSKTGCNMHVASVSPYWFTKEFAKVIFAVPFNQWGYERVTALVYEDNPRSWKFIERIGFVLEGVMRGLQPVRVYGLLKSESRW